jgi:hypothetical protein
MNYRPYPDTDRALAQLRRGRVQQTPPRSPTTLAAQRFLESFTRAVGMPLIHHPRQSGKSVLQRAIVDEAVAFGEHVHVAGLDGVKCAGGDDDCTVTGE